MLKPYLIASHLDVVPASNDFWEVPPFEGRVQDGYFWGRGTLDVKNGVMVSITLLNNRSAIECVKKAHKTKLAGLGLIIAASWRL